MRSWIGQTTAAFGILAAALLAQDAPKTLDLAELPAVEAHLFKDGHAFVVREGLVELDADGRALVGDLPNPVLGSFWPRLFEEDLALDAVVAARRPVTVRRPCRGLAELVDANPGARVEIIEVDGKTWDARIMPTSRESGPPDFFLFRNDRGVHALPRARLRALSFKSEHVTEIETVETREVLEFRVRGGAVHAGRRVKLGIAWLEKGMAWTPQYRIEIDGRGRARCRLRAAIRNELADLADARVHLVVGVPEFAFADMRDPISLDALVRNAAASAQDASLQNFFAGSNGLSNMITQVAGSQPASGPAEIPGSLQGGVGLEDLHVHTLEDVTLGKGEAMSREVAAFELAYEDVYVLDLPISPPALARRTFVRNRLEELRRLAEKPRPAHVLRIANGTEAPLTTAPALVLRAGRVIAQGALTYTPVGGRSDLVLNKAIDLLVEVEDVETGRRPDALTADNDRYHRVDYRGRLSLTNRKDRAVRIEVRRWILGHVESVESGEAEAVSPFSDDEQAAGAVPAWWSAYSWPIWWGRVNAFVRLRWDLSLEPGESAELVHDWYHYWR